MVLFFSATDNTKLIAQTLAKSQLFCREAEGEMW